VIQLTPLAISRQSTSAISRLLLTLDATVARFAAGKLVRSGH